MLRAEKAIAEAQGPLPEAQTNAAHAILYAGYTHEELCRALVMLDDRLHTYTDLMADMRTCIAHHGDCNGCSLYFGRKCVHDARYRHRKLLDEGLK